MRLAWTPQALADLDRVLTYIAERNPRAATSIAQRIEATVATIPLMPLAGRYDRETGVFCRVVPRLPLLIIYNLNHEDDVAEIIAVFHTSRDPDSRLGE